MKCYSVLFENDHFLIVNKISGISVHKNLHDREITLIDQIKIDRGSNYFLVHRIDKYTSGALLLAKSKDALLSVQKLFLDNKVEKNYLAIVTRELPAKKLKITLSLGRNKNNKLRFSNKNAKNYKQACTEAEVINSKLVKLSLQTGRTHQIRAHLFSINCPVLNDPIYGNDCFDPTFGQYLHSYRLSFKCPITSEVIDVLAPLPRKFLMKLQEMNITAIFP